jgi:shikimate dehydrogenase
LCLGIVGEYLGHTWSPVIHTALLKLLGLQGNYQAYPTSPQNLANHLANLAAQGLVGLNITVPYKQAVLPLLVGCTPQAQAIGAVNTLSYNLAQQGWLGHNTDADGWWASLPWALQQQLQHPASAVLMLGAGGAAKAMLWVLAQQGVGNVTLAVRNPAKAQAQLADWWQHTLGQAQPLCFCGLPPEGEELTALLPAFAQACATADALINTTPLGMHPHTQGLPMPASALALCQPHAWLVDAVYNPKPTRWLKLGAAQGLATVDGLGMLLHQAQRAMAWWTKLSPEAFGTTWLAALEQAVKLAQA